MDDQSHTAEQKSVLVLRYEVEPLLGLAERNHEMGNYRHSRCRHHTQSQGLDQQTQSLGDKQIVVPVMGSGLELAGAGFGEVVDSHSHSHSLETDELSADTCSHTYTHTPVLEQLPSRTDHPSPSSP